MTHKKTIEVQIKNTILDVEYFFYPTSRIAIDSKTHGAYAQLLTVSYKGVSLDVGSLSEEVHDKIQSEIYIAEGID